MKGFVLPAALAAFVTLVNVLVPVRVEPFPVPLDESTVTVGAYDPHGRLAGIAGIGMDHVFVDWNMPPARTAEALATAAGRGRSLMVSLEPFPAPGSRRDALASDVLAGRYDDRLGGHCRALRSAPGKVYFRFAHEMDFDNGRYAWSGLEPGSFIAMYRRAVALCRTHAPRVVLVWSPGGDAALTRYYPGDEAADMIGLSLFGLQPWELAVHGRGRRFDEVFAEKYRLVTRYGKPVIIAEFGVCGGARYRARWIADALRRGVEQFPLLQAVVFFNDREPYNWPGRDTTRKTVEGCDAESPDWRIGKREP